MDLRRSLHGKLMTFVPRMEFRQRRRPTASRASTSLYSFHPCTPAEVRRITMTSPVKSCSLNAVPTFFVSEFIDVFLLYLTSMVNASLVQGRLPVSQRHAIVTPLLKTLESTARTCLTFVLSRMYLSSPRLLNGPSPFSSRITCLPITFFWLRVLD